MATQYLFAKFAHILIAVVALGTSAGLGIVLEFFGDHPTHGSFVRRAIVRLMILVVLPGYMLMLATGIWLVNLSWSFTVAWVQWAMAMWVFGLLPLVASLVLLGKQRAVLESFGAASPHYRRLSMLSRGAGACFGLVVVRPSCSSWCSSLGASSAGRCVAPDGPRIRGGRTQSANELP